MSKEISSEKYEVALDKEREEFFGSMEEIRLDAEQAVVKYGIPLEKFDEKWNKFITELDSSLVENFSLDRDPEDMP